MYQSNTLSCLEICSVNEIHELNEMKQYTITSTYLLKTILTDSNLTPTAARLWQYIYSLAHADDNLEIKISYRKLAIVFSKSTRTIARYMSNLAENGYIAMKHNSLSNGGYDINTIQVRFPQHVIANAKKTPDRRSFSSKHGSSSLLSRATSNKNGCSTYNMYPKNPSFNQKALDKESNNTFSSPIQLEPQPLTEANDLICDKNVRRGYDKNVIQINTSNKNIIINNNVVVDDRNDNSSDNLSRNANKDSLTPLLHKAKKELANLTLAKPTNQNDTLQWYNDIRKLHSRMCTLEVLLSRGEDNTKIQSTLTKSPESFNKSQDYVMYLGSRPVNDFHIKRIQKELTELAMSEQQKAQLLNEIIYAVRFGPLRVKKSKQSELSVAHGINIALKLIRENRWETPI
jgi:hypothetical protein